MRDEKGKITVKSVWKFIRSEKGRKYSFVIFYAIFFIFLFIFLRAPATYIEEKPKEEISSLPFVTSKVESNNYNFIYKEIINEKEITFEGTRENNLITINNERDRYDYQEENGELTFLGDLNPINYYKLLSIYNVKSLLKDASLVSKVEFPGTSEFAFNYDIESSTLAEFFGEELISDEESLNRVIVNCNKDLEVTSINFDIYNYWKQENTEDTETTSYVIELDYREES